MTKKKLNEIKTEHLENILRMLKEEGGMVPHITVYAEKRIKKTEEDKKPAIISIPVTDEHMESEDAKENFVNKLLIKIFKEIKKDFIPFGVMWVSEAWTRKAPLDFDSKKQNFKELPIDKEVLIMVLSTKNKEEVNIFEIKRDGMQVNNEGEMIDTIDLIDRSEDFNPSDKLEGRFCELFKIFDKV